MQRYFLFFISIFLSYFSSYGQNTLSGYITDQLDKPLPFVNILINAHPRDGVTTDINGFFSISHKTSINQLTFSYLGFEKLVLSAPFSLPLKVQLKPTAYEQETIIVVAGENPAHSIIRRVVANKALNDPEKMQSYSCKTYNKMVVGYALDNKEMESFYSTKDTSRKMLRKQYLRLKKFHNTFDKQDLLLVESVTNRNFKKPKDMQEEVILNRVAGSTKLPLAAIATQTQPFSFYKEEIVILEQAFLNPISRNSTKKYFFNLRDTLFQQQDTVFIISFHPRKGKNFEGLEGLLYINSKNYAIQNVIAKPTKDHLLQFEITQKYQWVANQQWFPEQLHFELETNAFPKAFAGIKSYGRTYISEVKLNPALDTKIFKEGEVIRIQEQAYSSVDSLWNNHRKEVLSQKEKRTYRIIDSIGEHYKIDRYVSLLEMISRSRFKMGIVDYNIKNALKLNNYEGLRLGIGLTTNEVISRHFEIGGYYAYGLRDKAWKYGANFTILFDKNRDNYLDFVYKNDLAVPNNPAFNNSFLNYSQFSDIRDQLDYKGVHLHTYPLKYFGLNLQLNQQRRKPLYDYELLEVRQPTFTLAELSIKGRYAYNEKFVRVFGQRILEASRYPILEFSFTQGFKGFLEGDLDYTKYQLAISHTFRRKALGKTSYRIEAGSINNTVPYSQLFSTFGLGRGLDFLNVTHAFQAMDFNEFLSDKFVYLFFRHDFSSLLFKTKKFKPGIILAHNLAFGSLKNPEFHQNIEFKTLEKGYFEGGLVIENILRIRYFNMAYIGLGAGAFYRYGAYQFPSFKDNVALRLQISISY